MKEGAKERFELLEKLKRVLSWAKENIYYKRNIRSKILIDVYTFIYASGAVHNYMRSHTGGGIYMGHGVAQKKHRCKG